MFNSFNSTIKKILVVFLIMTLTYANLALIGSNIVESLNSYAVEEQKEKTTNEEPANVEETKNNLPVEDEKLVVVNNKDIHKTKISEDGEVQFGENVEINLYNIPNESNVMIEDVLNEFYNNDETLNEEISFKYNTSIMNKKKLLSILKEEGKLVISDAITENVLVELTSEFINAQTIDEKVEQKFNNNKEEKDEEEIRTYVTIKEETVEIEYAIDVEKIKFEISKITTINENANIKEDVAEDEEENNEIINETFTIENMKNISNIKDVESLIYLKENKNVTVNEEENNIESIIKFKDTITRASLELDNTAWVLGESNTVNYTVILDTTTEKTELYRNPMFLIELPSNVESINTEDSRFTINNDGGVFTEKRVFATTVLGKKYVVIALTGEQTLESIENGNTTINLSLELNISADETEGSKITKLYYQNDTVTAYESGTSFDTDEVEILLILNNEEQNDIFEDNIKYAEYDIFMNMQVSTEQALKEEEKLEYTLSVYNYGAEDINDLLITNILPENVILENVVNENNEKINYEYDEETRTIKIEVDVIKGATQNEETDEDAEENKSITIAGSKTFIIETKTGKLENGVYNKELINIVKIQKDETVLDEAKVENILTKKFIKINVEQLEEQISENQEIVFSLTVENKSITSDNADIKIDIPEEISPKMYKTSILSEDGKIESEGEGTLNSNFEMSSIYLEGEKTYSLKMLGDIKNVDASKTITIKGFVNEEEVSWTTQIVKVNEPEQPEEVPSQPTEPSNPEVPSEPTDSNGTGENDNSENTPSLDEPVETIFDLSLNQYLNKVTVANSKGTTVYNYKDTNFAKVEIHSKQMDGSKVTLEYKIIVKNEGTIPGYARKIVDYIPKDLSFSQEQNIGWYVGDDGNIYSTELLEKLLKPGETAELTVVLEKQMTNENVGTITTQAEIYEASNDQNIEDINSIPGDKVEGQNDISKVEVLVTVSTGIVILYLTLAIVFVAIICMGFYKVKKVTLNKKGGC